LHKRFTILVRKKLYIEFEKFIFPLHNSQQNQATLNLFNIHV